MWPTTHWVLPLLALALVPGGLALVEGSQSSSAVTGTVEETADGALDPAEPVLEDADGGAVDGATDTLPTGPDEGALDPVTDNLPADTDAGTSGSDDGPLTDLLSPVLDPVTDLTADTPVIGTSDQGPAHDGAAGRGVRSDGAAQGAAVATVAVAAQAGGTAWLPVWQHLQSRAPIPSRLRGLGWAAGAPLTGLFSRIEDELSDSPVRAGILAHLRANPGSSIRAIQQAQEVAWGTTVYHLNRLEKAGHIVSHRNGRARRYWDAHSAEAAQRRRAIVLKSETPRRLAVAVFAEPGLAQKELCTRLEVSASVASKHLSRLVEAGLVEVQARARSRIYCPTPVLERVAGMMEEWPLPDMQDPVRPVAKASRDAKPICGHVHAHLCTQGSSPSASASA